MSNRDKTGGTEDPRSLIDQLRRDLADQDGDGSVLSEEPTDDEVWADGLLRDAEIGYPASVSAAADALMPARELSLPARDRMIKAAERALADRRSLRGLLPVLLRVVRQQRGMSVFNVASVAGLPESIVKELETGERVVDRRLSTITVAHWISAVPVEREPAINALRKSLQATWQEDTVLAAGSSSIPSNVDEYLADVSKELDRIAQEGSQ
jgi:hypothetical protein